MLLEPLGSFFLTELAVAVLVGRFEPLFHFGADLFEHLLAGFAVSAFFVMPADFLDHFIGEFFAFFLGEGFVAVGISVLIGILMGGIAGYYGQNQVRADQMIASVVILAGLGLLVAGSWKTGSVLIVLAIIYLMFSQGIRVAGIKRVIPQWLAFLFEGALSIDTVIMRFVDIMLCFPSFFLILTVVALLPASIYNIMIVIGLTSWMGTTRFVRAEFLSLREQDFVTAAWALGVGDWRIIFRHMIPNAIAPVLVSATIGIASAILTEAGLSFLGFGVPPPHATWGNILSDGKRFIFDAPWLTFVPGFAILIVVLSFNLFGEGLRDILNPKLRERY